MSKQKAALSSPFQENLAELAGNLTMYLHKTKQIPQKVFTGPSLYFHQEAIKEISKNFLGKRHREMIYAVLTSWGMHRMGNNKVKLKSFGNFEREIDKVADGLKMLKRESISSICDVEKIVELIFDIHVSESNSYIVSSTKMLHHILPELVAPIDRAYSIRFMKQKSEVFDTSTIQLSSQKHEKELAGEFLTEMKSFIKKFGNKMKRDNCFNTSLPKIFDNLIVAFVRDKRGDSVGEDE